jgi:hypothetical protein
MTTRPCRRWTSAIAVCLVLATSLTASSGGQPADQPVDAADPLRLVRAVVEAMGGIDVLQRVTTLHTTADSTMFTMGGSGVGYTTIVSAEYPDRFRIESRMPGLETVEVYDAGDAWRSDPFGVRPASTNNLAARVRREMIPLLVEAFMGRLRVDVLPNETTSDGALIRVIEVAGPQLQPVQLYIDQDMRIIRRTYRAANPTGGTSFVMDERLSDYRAVSGVQMPFSISVVRNGTLVATHAFSRIVVNAPLSERLFERPR